MKPETTTLNTKMADAALQTHSLMWEFDQCEQTFRLDFHNALFV